MGLLGGLDGIKQWCANMKSEEMSKISIKKSNWTKHCQTGQEFDAPKGSLWKCGIEILNVFRQADTGLV
jgi:hypothetical protein